MSDTLKKRPSSHLRRFFSDVLPGFAFVMLSYPGIPLVRTAMNLKKMIRVLLQRHFKPDTRQAQFDVNRASSDETMSRIKEALLRTSAYQKRATKLLEQLDK